ncbi:hypothetical protein [Pseudomonas sp. MS15a(2019)]|uniref:hypothetical protein n=1 Tax=Pseudomonas sp. MS15a(2019) TaxID=2579938 RepID=UPI0015669D09|nr:hypothetical protein [Pseudomonas sp. MS15a(2019)]NRH40653.1 hypothetical protein [Pseudomonas sp. MS15a(2019)]
MKAVQIRNYNGKIIPFDSYDPQILQRLEQIITAEGVGYGFIIQPNTDADVTQLLRNFERNDCPVHALRISVVAGTVFIITIPESHRRHLSYRLHEVIDSEMITEFTDLDYMFKIAAPLTATRRLDKGRRPKSRLLLSATK